VRGAFFSLACLLAGPAAAEEASLLDFMGGQGCTFGTDSRVAAGEAGFDAAAIDALIATTLANGTARLQRAYVVLEETICTIRLPYIQSPYSVASPEIVAITSAINAYAADGEPGCFLGEPHLAFDAMKGGSPRAGFAEYIAFIGAGIIAGDLRFYSPSVLRTPVGFQNVRGPCAVVPDIKVIDRSHVALTTGFGGYVRALGAEMPCEGDQIGDIPFDTSVMAHYTATIQGADPSDVITDQIKINAWLWFEYDLITMAAGWHEGMTGMGRGTPRPPLCHYPPDA
jgi:hypothetical protein